MGKLTVVGIGPGDRDDLTLRADRALQESDVIVGYHVYVDLVRPWYPDREYLTTPMTREVSRCRMALEAAEKGRRVVMICSGDAGVYGMASLCFELRGDRDTPEIEIVPGLTSALSGGALLGAPLTHDFCVISLSDLMTPWETIEKRLRAAAAADFVICLYNPSSHKRKDYLARACDILLEHAAPKTVCGIARNIGREGERTELLTLTQLRDTPADMFSTVFIGNGDTRVIGGKLVTPRGYHDD